MLVRSNLKNEFIVSKSKQNSIYEYKNEDDYAKRIKESSAVKIKRNVVLNGNVLSVFQLCKIQLSKLPFPSERKEVSE